MLDGEPVTVFESDKVRALLAYLAVESDRPHRRETLAGLLWPERSERSARHNLSQALSNLRRAIGSPDASVSFLETSQHAVRLSAESECTLDVSAFAGLVAGCTDHSRDQRATCDGCMEQLQEAVQIYRGDFLEGFSLADSPAFEEWVVVQRERLHRMAIDALQLLCRCHEVRGELDEALHCAWRWVALDPWRERAHREVMRLLAKTGQRSAALRQYETCRRALADELGVEPSQSTTELFQQIRDGSYDASAPAIRKDVAETQRANTERLRVPRRLVAISMLVVFAVVLIVGVLAWYFSRTSEYSCESQSQIPRSECQVLVTLYGETEGAGWKQANGWLANATPCKWYGVVCDRESVVQLNLSDNLLAGSIPAELGLLSNLSVLDLGFNQLAGRIPPELGNLRNLTSLSLVGNSQLSGPIPPELGDLARLQGLYLSTYDRGSSLSGPIPPQLGNLTGLMWLEISNSQVEGPIPPELGKLTHLMSLDLGYNQLSGPIPPELGNLSDLRYLNVCGNAQLSGPIPPELGKLSRLESLYLSSDIDGGTMLSGPIPPELGNLKMLRYLDISNSLIDGPIPPELGNLTNLEYLSLVQNPQTGPVPAELGNLVKLRTLSVGEGSSQLKGPLPPTLVNLRQMEYFTYGTNTELCEPTDAAFQEWLRRIPTLAGPRVPCESGG